MKITKNLMISALVAGLAFAAPNANAACAGTVIKGTNGHEYCQSTGEMNWWSAYAWCEVQGMRLATIYEMCPDWAGSVNVDCTNLKNVTAFRTWTSTAAGNSEAFCLYSGNIRKQVRTGGELGRCTATCY